MKPTRFSRAMTRGAAAGLTMLLTISLIAGGSSASAQDDRVGRLRVVKDCAMWSGTPGSTFCKIVSSNIPELPRNTKIYYNQITDGPAAGRAGFLDSTIFVYVNRSQWAVGRCTVPNDPDPNDGALLPNDDEPGLCTLSDGVGALAGLSARIVVTSKPGGSGYLYAWDGTYRFKTIQ